MTHTKRRHTRTHKDKHTHDKQTQTDAQKRNKTIIQLKTQNIIY